MKNTAATSEEPLKEAVVRKSVNSWLTTKSFCRKSDRNLRIAVKQAQLYRAKSSFGVEYMGKMESGSPDNDLDECVQSSRDKVGVLNDKIQSLQEDKQRIDEKLRSKLRASPNSEGVVEAPSVQIVVAQN
eukprot:CAMPEP_0168741432 /NCGR_PEP_ID=MMETSP0724-20121128/12511_1 /TAXON_ID=265536 /ORGANISM="Amphiprora sp., Strain CCMP467" /LENGTH=129 /DNA_ID=CAMNT_0008788937 /DNA_START=128 /DNA_END=517 /DNA_ORIENTATION=-